MASDELLSDSSLHSQLMISVEASSSTEETCAPSGDEERKDSRLACAVCCVAVSTSCRPDGAVLSSKGKLAESGALYTTLLSDTLLTPPRIQLESTGVGDEMRLCRRCVSLLDDIDCAIVRLTHTRRALRTAYTGARVNSDGTNVCGENGATETCVDATCTKTNADVNSVERLAYSARNVANTNSAADDKTGAGTCQTDADPAAKTKRRFVCQVCGRAFKQSQSLAIHTRTHTGERPFACGDCDRAFRERDALAKHRLIHSDQRPHLCDVCGARFRQRSVLVRHIRTHTGDRPHVCRVCRKGFIERYALAAHERHHEVDEGRRSRLYCALCDRSYRDAYWFSKHQMQHRGQCSHMCPVCGKAFVDARVLRVHVLGHSAERSHVCDTCGAGFKSASHLARHERTHSGVRPFVCGVCDRAFADQSALKRHSGTHLKRRPFMCDNCGAAFQRRDALLTHFRSTCGTVGQADSSASNVDDCNVKNQDAVKAETSGITKK